MTHPGRKCSTLQNTFSFIICELLTDGDRRLTAFHYMEDVRFAGSGRCLQIVMACDAHGQVGRPPPTPKEVRRITPFLPLETPACDLARGAGVESKQKCVVFCIDLINTVLSSLYGQVRLYYSHDK